MKIEIINSYKLKMKFGQRTSSFNTTNLKDHFSLNNSFSFQNISKTLNDSQLDTWEKKETFLMNLSGLFF